MLALTTREVPPSIPHIFPEEQHEGMHMSKHVLENELLDALVLKC
jgi:hypothetical protein